MDRHPNPAIAFANDEVKIYLNADVTNETGITITSPEDVYRVACSRLGVDVKRVKPGEAHAAFCYWQMQRREYEAAHIPKHGIEPRVRWWKT